MAVKVTKTREIVAGDFDWTAYDDGWNGTSLRVNKKVKGTDKNTKVYCHEAYAQDVYNQYMHQAAPISKELKKNTLVKANALSTVRLHTRNKIISPPERTTNTENSNFFEKNI